MTTGRLAKPLRNAMGAGRRARRVLGSARRRQASTSEPPLLRWPLDHYYSPVPNNRTLTREPARSRVWPEQPRPSVGIDWREQEQVSLVRGFARFGDFELPERPTGDPRDFHLGNDMFSRLDAWVLQAMLRHLRPERMIEVGCGWSSLLSARVNREHLGGSMQFTCIEPYPPDYLAGIGVEGISRLIPERVEELALDPFSELRGGDVLFIDTSHVVKTGGDVVFLFQEVVPRLAPGVVVHVHDIFMPRDYPEAWVLSGRAWNEQYLVQSFLSFNSAFRILLGSAWLTHCRPDVLESVLPDYPASYGDGGGSLWIERC